MARSDRALAIIVGPRKDDDNPDGSQPARTSFSR
jgi:hypothetical protein